MNKTLTALITKLSWQLKEVNQALTNLVEELSSLQLKLVTLEEKIHKACSTPAQINPEQEISRLNYIVHRQQEHEHFSLEKKELESREAQLVARKLRLNTEMKMLEKYQLKQQKDEQLKTLAIEQKESDEWIIQKRN